MVEDGSDEDEARDDPVVVFRCGGDVEAGVVRALLESYGIPCGLASDITHVAYPFTVDGLGEVRLTVPAPLAREAREIINAHRAASGIDSVSQPSNDESGAPRDGDSDPTDEDAGGKAS